MAMVSTIAWSCNGVEFLNPVQPVLDKKKEVKQQMKTRRLASPLEEDRGVVEFITLKTARPVPFAWLGHPARRAFRIYGYKFWLAKKGGLKFEAAFGFFIYDSNDIERR